MHEVLEACDAEPAKMPLDHAVVGERETLCLSSGLGLAEAALIDQCTGGLEGWVAVGEVWLHTLDHLLSGLVDTQEDSAVNLAETKELEDLLGLGVHVAHTTDTDNKHQLRLGLAEVVADSLGLAALADKCTLLGGVLSG